MLLHAVIICSSWAVQCSLVLWVVLAVQINAKDNLPFNGNKPPDGVGFTLLVLDTCIIYLVRRWCTGRDLHSLGN